MIPPFHLQAAPGTAWRLALGALVGLAAATALAWLVPASDPVAALACAGAIAAGATLLHLPAVPLRWDGRRFKADGPGDGALDLCIDLGGWMLLRWRPAATSRPWHARWIPVSARSIDAADWHALRCALHQSPAPAAAPEAGHG